MAKALKSRFSATILFREICTDLRESDVHISNECPRCLFHITSEESKIFRALAIWKQPHSEEMPELEAREPLYLLHFPRKYPQFCHIPQLTKTVSTWNDPHSRVVCYDYTNQDSRKCVFLPVICKYLHYTSSTDNVLISPTPFNHEYMRIYIDIKNSSRNYIFIYPNINVSELGVKE